MTTQKRKESKPKRPPQSVCIGIIKRDEINPLRLQTEEDYNGRYNEKLVENYRGFNILKRNIYPEWYYAIQDSNLTLSSIPVARRCIDTYFNHLEMQENELSR